ncbi:MAG: putative membrane protein YedE/YeeE [Enterobacterales bacterium]|jgi:uncharacterized membrane protein YedE/YeeE
MKIFISGLVTFFSGICFAIGLTLAGMTIPSKVIAFLDVTGGQWDPSLMFVMIGAITVYAVMFHFIKPKMDKPLYAPKFKLPTRTKVDVPMLVGAAMFGAGWGIGGFCPGPAIASASLLDMRTLVFLACMIVGMYLAFLIQPLIPSTLYRKD